MEVINIIATSIIAAAVGRIIKKYSKKKDNKVIVPVYLPYTKEDLLYELAFGLMAILAWGLALWIFRRAHFSWDQFLTCLLITIGGLSFLLLHLVSHQIRVPKGKEHLAESAKYVLVKSNRLVSLFCFPFMAAYLISKNPTLFGISWDFEWVSLGILVLACVISITLQTKYSKQFHFDMTDSDLMC